MNPSSPAAQVDPVLVRDALQRLLQSSFVPDGSVLAKMLSHVVERTLVGDGRSIKAYTIAVEAFGRPSDFDPDRDSAVRVTAMRLRTALDLYYAGPGADDPLRIRMVPGSYRPLFEPAAVQAAPAPAGESMRPASEADEEPVRRARAPALAGWLAALTIILALNVVMTVSLMAYQLRGDGVTEVQAVKPAFKGVRTAEKPPQRDPVYDLIRHNVQRSFQQSVE
ncbi:MAG: hypothetical protein FD152_2787 [Xanthobacteraceae bacterium]|nr:MAG: hypothetical protein FD152_2787 [Xanthobacteraceae bacterium]